MSITTRRKKLIIGKVSELIESNSIAEAPINLNRIARSLNIEILSKPSEDDLSGFLFRDFANGQNIIGINQNHHPNRKRFTLAHEIGHFILHNHEGFHFDSKNQSYLIKLRKTNSDLTNEIEEQEANLFAAELLMPKIFLERDIIKFKNADLLFDDNIPDLARKYKVSVRALTFRLANLGHIDLSDL
jgi:Zn-dependent peptidase ImmA (M78 family)